MSSNQNIEVSGEGNVIRVFGSGKVRIGNQSVTVSGTVNSVVVSGGDLHIGGQPPKRKPPKVSRATRKVWCMTILL